MSGPVELNERITAIEALIKDQQVTLVNLTEVCRIQLETIKDQTELILRVRERVMVLEDFARTLTGAER